MNYEVLELARIAPTYSSNELESGVAHNPYRTDSCRKGDTFERFNVNVSGCPEGLDAFDVFCRMS